MIGLCVCVCVCVKKHGWEGTLRVESCVPRDDVCASDQSLKLDMKDTKQVRRDSTFPVNEQSIPAKDHGRCSRGARRSGKKYT